MLAARLVKNDYGWLGEEPLLIILSGGFWCRFKTAKFQGWDLRWKKEYWVMGMNLLIRILSLTWESMCSKNYCFHLKETIVNRDPIRQPKRTKIKPA